MSNELCGLSPHARAGRATVVSQRKLAQHTYAIRLHCPAIARSIVPGQFFMIRPQGGTDPLLGRPFALYDTVVNGDQPPEEFEFAYHVIGKMTGLMSHWVPGQPVEVWGPLGNGFPVFTGQRLLCVGGGIGYTPFLAAAREALGLRKYGAGATERWTSHETSQAGPVQVDLCYGVQTRAARADLSDFTPLQDLRIHIATDDGTEGRAGFVTGLVDEFLKQSPGAPDGVYCCGPEPMMHAVARLCAAAEVPCWLSLETPMACGFGACFSCVTKVRDEQSSDGWDYRRTCVEGPVFAAERLALT